MGGGWRGNVQGFVVDRRLGLLADLTHHLDGSLWVAALCGLAREHDAVRAVEHGVGDVGDLHR